MTSTVRARYENGVLTPLQPVSLQEGEEVTVSIEGGSSPLRPGIAAMLRDIEEMDAALSPEERDAPRSDGAKRYKDILYGLPVSEG